MKIKVNKVIEVYGEDKYLTVLENPVYTKDTPDDERNMGLIFLQEGARVKLCNLSVRNLQRKAESAIGVSSKSTLLCVDTHISCKNGVGVFFKEKSKVVLTRTKVYESNMGIINHTQGGEIICSGCEFSFCEMYAIAVRQEVKVSIDKCVFCNNPQQALIATRKSILKITNTVFKDNATYPECKTAVLLANLDDAYISDCSFFNNQFQSLQIRASRVIFTRNSIGVNSTCVTVQSGTNIIMSGNKFENSAFGVWITENGKGRVILEGNSFEKVTLPMAKQDAKDLDPEIKGGNQPSDIKCIIFENVKESRGRFKKKSDNYDEEEKGAVVKQLEDVHISESKKESSNEKAREEL